MARYEELSVGVIEPSSAPDLGAGFTVDQLNKKAANGDVVTGSIAVCRDGNAGAICLAIYDGTDWLRLAPGAAIATS